MRIFLALLFLPLVALAQYETTPIGVVWSDNFNRVSLGANWTVNGASVATVEANTLKVSAASAAVANSVVYNPWYVCADQWTVAWAQWWTNFDANSYGCLVGLHNEQSQGGDDRNYYAELLGAGGSINKLVIGRAQSGTTFTTISTSSGSITMAVNDHINCTFTTSGVTLTATATNSANGSGVSVTATLNYNTDNPPTQNFTPTISRITVSPVIGPVYVDNISFTINSSYPARYVVVGDSITDGEAATTVNNRYSGVIQSNMLERFNVEASGFNATPDAVNDLLEIESYGSSNVVMMIGGNDLLFGFSAASYQSNYNYIVTNLQARGATVWHCLPTPRNGTDERPLTNWIRTTYPIANIINTFTPLQSGASALSGTYDSGDGTHPNVAGHLLIAQLIMTNIPSERYVVPSGSNAKNGLTWDNGFADLPSSGLIRGDTYHVAGGASYAAHTFADAVAGTSMIVVQKASPSLHGATNGYQSSFGSSQATFAAPVIYHTGFVLMDGAYRSNPTNGYGFKILNGGSSSQNLEYGIAQNDAAWNCTNQYCEVQGSAVMSDAGPLDVGVQIWHTAHDNAIRYDWIHDVGASSFFMRQCTNTLVEQNWVNRNFSSSLNHAEGMSIAILVTNLTVRYNAFEDIEGTAFIATPGQAGTDTIYPLADLYFYGNSFGYSTNNATLGAGAIMQGVSAVGFIFDCIIRGNFYWVNNSAYNIVQSAVSSGWGSLDARVLFGDGSTGLLITNAVVENNLWYGCTNGGVTVQNGSIWTSAIDYNYYGQIGVVYDSGAHKQTTSANPLVNWQGRNFQLALATATGITLASPFDQDPNGNTRGADGNWDRGAYEFIGGPPPPPPAAFTNQIFNATIAGGSSL